MAGDAEDPRQRLAIVAAAEAGAIGERLRERLGEEIDGDLRLQRAPREKPQ